MSRLNHKIAQSKIPYIPNCTQVFQYLVHEPWAILLDSCQPFAEQGRFDIMTAGPRVTLTTYGNKTLINNGAQVLTSFDDPFTLVKHTLPDQPSESTLPFNGGAMGYFGYDLIRRELALNPSQEHQPQIPDMAIGIYDWAIVTDHLLKKSFLVAPKNRLQEKQQWLQSLHHKEKPNLSAFELRTPYQSNISKTAYQQKFQQITQHLTLGNCYQINLTQRFDAIFTGNPWRYYQQLRQKNPAPFAGFFNHPDVTLLSFSPERFLQVNNRYVETKPIKGTRPRGKSVLEDQQFEQALLTSSKDKAENLMIVDLLRNDLSKNCVAGSVKVPKLFALEKFANVMHLVSTVTGRLQADKHPVDLLKGCFPGGSVTGTPKRRAMEIISALEPHRRTAYCGSLGYIDQSGHMDTNIIIRTLICQNQKIYCHAGGAILIDSDWEKEYQEALDKIRFVLDSRYCASLKGGVDLGLAFPDTL